MKDKTNWEDSRLYYQYLKDIQKYPLLTKEEERTLLREIQLGSTQAIQKLTCSNLKFVINVAFMYRGQGFSLPELINEGNIGLIEAAKRFDYNKKIRFISYAVWWIRQSITRAIAEKARIVRISAEKELILRRISKHQVKTRYLVGGGFAIDIPDLAKKMGYTEKKMEKILEMGQHHSSLNTPVAGDPSSSLMDIIENDKTEKADKQAIENSRNKVLQQNLKKLTSQEQKVITMYFGLGEQKQLSLKDIGHYINLSKERVRQIKEKGLANLRGFNMPKEQLLAT